MNKILSAIKENPIFVIVCMFVVMFLSQCSDKRSIDRLSKEVESLKDSTNKSLTIINNTLDSTTTIEQVRSENEQLLYLFLLFEESLDKNTISLPEIKLKLEELQKND